MRRKSRYGLALGNLLKLVAARLASTSQSATTFSLLTLPRSDAPCPPMPMQAMLSLLLGGVAPRKPRTELGTIEMVARVAEVLRRNPRRVIWGAVSFIIPKGPQTYSVIAISRNLDPTQFQVTFQTSKIHKPTCLTTLSDPLRLHDVC